MSVCRLFRDSVCNAPTAYTSFFRGQKYLLKIPYFILDLDYSNVAGFLSFDTVIFWQVDNTALCLKKYHKNERFLGLETQSFAKISQNVCLIIRHFLIYWHADVTASYGTPFNFIAFFGYFHTSFSRIHVSVNLCNHLCYGYGSLSLFKCKIPTKLFAHMFFYHMFIIFLFLYQFNICKFYGIKLIQVQSTVKHHYSDT